MSEQQAASDVLVSFRGVQKSYDGESLIVKSLDLDIRRGEFLTMLGPSGSGKTTCLMMLAGFETPTHGEIRLGGQLLNNVPPHKRNIGMVFQNYALFPHMTVAENLAYPLSIRKMSKSDIEARVKKALDMVKLGSLANRYPGQMSGGQQQRVALARALVFEPQLVLMDEPLGALDKQLREHMQLEIKHIHETLGVTVVYVTHDQSEALTMSDRVAVFNEGIIQQIDQVDRLYETPSNRFVASFVGDNSVLNGTVAETHGEQCTVQLGDGLRLRGVNVNQASVGDAVQCSIRPERIHVLDGSTAPAENILSVGLSDVIYFGDHLRLRCELPQQPELCVKQPLQHHGVLNAGQRLSLHIPAEHLRVYR